MKLSEFKNYIGDVNIEHGGTFFDLSNWGYGYVDALRIIDLDSAAGIDQTAYAERVTILVDDHDDVKNALACYGQTFADLRKLPDSHARKLLIANACLDYGYYDSCADFTGPYAWEIFQTWDDDDERPERFNMHAEYTEIEDGTLFAWLEAQGMLTEFE